MLWLDGTELSGTVAPFDLRDRGLMLGDGLFDTSLVVNGRMVWADAHLDRLAAGCTQLGIPFDRAAVESTAATASARLGRGALRITVTRGVAPRGLIPPDDCVPHVIVAAYPGLPATMFCPVALGTTAIRRNEHSPLSRIKALSYLDAVLATREVWGNGAEEALFLNTAGRVACCATGNLFIILGNTLVTPPLADGVLAGVSRAAVIRIAHGLGWQVNEQGLSPEEILCAGMVFVTNSLRLISVVSSIDGKRTAGPPHPIFDALLAGLVAEIARDCGDWSAPLERVAR